MLALHATCATRSWPRRSGRPGGAGRGRSRRRGRHDLRDRRRRRSDRHAIRRARSRASTPSCWWPKGCPAVAACYPSGADETSADWRIIVDPIDGTRGLMYQKRSAWILTGVAPNRGPGTSLSDIELAVQTEIPLVKQHLSRPVVGRAGRWRARAALQPADRRTGPLRLRPSAASEHRARLRDHRPLLSGRARRAGRDRRSDRARRTGTAARGQGALLRGSVRLDRRPAVRADRRARPLHRRPAAAAPSACSPVAGCRRRSPAIPTTSAAR